MKRTIEDLALFGGRKAFLHPLYVGRPNKIDRSRLFDRLNWALDNQWLTNGGPLARELEDRVAELTGVRHCVATCNATAALQLLIRSAGLTGEVIVPSMTFAATAHAVRWLGLDPVFADIDPVTACLDPADVAARITPRTSAIIGVHLWGRPCAVDELEKVAADNGIQLFFDSAHAFGVTTGGRDIGGFGGAEVFSFHATKVVNSFEGGAIVTDDDGLAERLRALHNFGIGLGEVNEAAGTNAKMSEAAAAMGLTSLDSFGEAIAHNMAGYELYRRELGRIPGLGLIEYDAEERQNYQYVIARVDPETSSLHRDLLHALLHAENVIAMKYFSPAVHQMEPYRSQAPVSLPHTEHLADQVLALPTGTTVSLEDIRRVCNIVRLAITHGAEITRRAARQQSQSA
ncbi:dTDP-4-dehydro-6-deoxyglucose aminotransferase [Saccharothrix xinjiangensis]|uniref:dTDP-4-dehydro-6-deoxyglucose aminotransferase n=1 Tax=Saccharothrix xinjiangensis TaxID=204798 RepID=A0ABV9YAM5_9PSEU